MKGFTLVEMLVVVSIFLTLLGIGYVRMTGIERRAPITATVNTLIADIRGMQTRAMTGRAASSYEINFSTYSVPPNISITSTYPASKMTFVQGSGDIIQGAGAITVTQTLTGEQKQLSVNAYGAITAIE